MEFPFSIFFAIATAFGWLTFKLVVLQGIILPIVNKLNRVTDHYSQVKAGASFIPAVRYTIATAVDIWFFIHSDFRSFAKNPFRNGPVLWPDEHDDLSNQAHLFYAFQFGLIFAEFLDWMFVQAPVEFGTFIAHHVATITLLVLSFQHPYAYPIAITTLLITDSTDVPLFTAKFLHHSGFGTVVEALLGFSILCYIFKSVLLTALLITIVNDAGDYWQQIYCEIFYSIIVLENIYWSLLLIRVAYKALSGGILEEPEHMKRAEIERKSGINIMGDYCGCNIEEKQFDSLSASSVLLKQGV